MNNLLRIILVLSLFSCENDMKEAIPNFQEKELSFLHLKFGYDKSNDWIKQPQNMLMLHETFKKIGYKNLISEEEWIDEWNPYIDVTKSPKTLIDSLEITYLDSTKSNKYYSEFWERREFEGNKEIVFNIIKEIKEIMIKNETLSVNHEIVNDTLEKLILFEIPNQEINDKEGNKHLDYLIKIGLHGSAYNLIAGENTSYEDINWKKEKTEVIRKLNKSEIYQRPWIKDNTP